MTRVVKNRIAANAYPHIYRLRTQVPRYNLHAQTRAFSRRAHQRGLGDARLYYWYHTVDLGGGPDHARDARLPSSVDGFCFPDYTSGMNVLDVGSATGFFAFEFEFRSAQVVSVEVPSLDEVDRFPYQHQDATQTVKTFASMLAGQSDYTDEELEVLSSTSARRVYELFLDGPFRLCHKALNSGVERRYATIYDLPETDLGAGSFDLVFLGDLLLHTIHPLKAMAAVASMCRGTLVISQHMPTDLRLGSRPAVLYVGGNTVEDHATWWYPNRQCFEQILGKLGFRHVEVVGRNTGVSSPGGIYYDRPVLPAVR